MFTLNVKLNKENDKLEKNIIDLKEYIEFLEKISIKFMVKKFLALYVNP